MRPHAGTWEGLLELARQAPWWAWLAASATIILSWSSILVGLNGVV
jgi:hypothetical protein